MQHFVAKETMHEISSLEGSSPKILLVKRRVWEVENATLYPK
jgi:hypothetical protein